MEQDTAFNVVTIAETLNVPKESNEIMELWKADEQLELILQPWSEESADALLSSHRSRLEGLTREG